MQVRKISWWSGPISAKQPLTKSKIFAAPLPFWHLQTLSSPSFSTLMPVGISLGLVLYQVIDDKEHVIRYGSHFLNKGESCYPVHNLEFLALKWAVMMVFHEYLFGNQFTVKSDNNPLTYILTTARLDAIGHCWVAQLASYDFTVLSKSGKTNIEADSLSRINWDWELTSEAVRVILNAAMGWL